MPNTQLQRSGLRVIHYEQALLPAAELERFEGSTSQATYIYTNVPSSSHFGISFGTICTFLIAEWINHASLCY
jgi:hypothetical protein